MAGLSRGCSHPELQPLHGSLPALAALRQAFRRNSKLYPAKHVAILRFVRYDGSPGLETKIISTTKAFESLQTDLDSDAMHRLVGIQMYSHELATPQSGVFHCNYSCDPKGRTKYTSVVLKKWPEVVEGRVEEDRGDEPEVEGNDDNFAAVQPWRHNTMIQATRSIVSFSEKTTNHAISSVTFEFMFDPATAQPVMMGVVSLALGETLRAEKENVVNGQEAIMRKVPKKKMKEVAAGVPAQQVELGGRKLLLLYEELSVCLGGTSDLLLAKLLSHHHPAAGCDGSDVLQGVHPPILLLIILSLDVASCFLGALPPVDLRAVCLVRAILLVCLLREGGKRA